MRDEPVYRWRNLTYPDMASSATLRDYFAAAALQNAMHMFSPSELAKIAYSYADAMLAERAK